ncbi:PiggyBac transposable element-derived protein 4 [Eumeta japonica]|uniref:PiggyBac transposable element-derived protein 4 n=1 Tax=Eumeta variegata TaxID=151549 RepID=A0A4C1U672_EUMVA|nr:PiggyBac transposable element-derived protein 4 [Eumeta japonica]
MDDELGIGERLAEQQNYKSDSEQRETDSENEAGPSSLKYSLGMDIKPNDEQLPAFRGRFSGLVYMPSKPNKYEIKHQAMIDAKRAYLQTFKIYVGTHPDGTCKQPDDTVSIVNSLTEPIKGTGRNITLDNWYTSIPLPKDLLQHRPTLVGTLRKNKNEIPSQFLPPKTNEVHSSKFGFCKELTLVSYDPKKSKAVILLSTIHHDAYAYAPCTICEDNQKKPEMIGFYNMSKSSVDADDKLYATLIMLRAEPKDGLL